MAEAEAVTPQTGGNMGVVRRRGTSVIRESGPWTPAVHRLLRHLVESGVHEVPAPVEITDDGHEVLSFLEGAVPTYPMPAWVWTDEVLSAAARLLRTIHDATAGVAFDGPWRSPSHEPAEVICHNDFAPYNLVFEGAAVVGVIDWDYASPGSGIWPISPTASSR